MPYKCFVVIMLIIIIVVNNVMNALLVQSDYLCCVFLQKNCTALHLAAMKGYNEVIDYLIQCGAAVNAVDEVSYYHNNVCVGVLCALIMITLL